MKGQSLSAIRGMALAAVMLAVLGSSALAQQPMGQTPPPPSQPMPQPSPRPQIPQEPPPSLLIRMFPALRPAAADTAGRSASSLPPSVRSGRPELLGDLPPLPVVSQLPDGTFVVLPSVRGFKIGDNDSPEPQDRTYVNYNYFSNLYGSINRRFGNDVRNVQMSKGTIGHEKTFCCESASVGFRIPIYMTSAQSSIAGLEGQTTLGDLSLLTKIALMECPELNLLFTGGMAITLPTGPSSLFNSPLGSRIHVPYLQPFLGYKWGNDRWNILGFLSLDVPLDDRDVTLVFNDLSLRYTLHESAASFAVINAIYPFAEVHVTTPLNHQGILRGTDPNGTPDMVNLTAGIDFRLVNHVKLVGGFVAPVTGPKPLDFEVISQLKISY